MSLSDSEVAAHTEAALAEGRKISERRAQREREVENGERTDLYYDVTDYNGNVLTKGKRVGFEDDGKWVGGVITLITDPDGDVDDEGRPVSYPPRVHVKFDDGIEDSFTTCWTATGPHDEDDAPFECEELELEKKE